MKKSLKLLSGTILLLFIVSSFSLGQVDQTDFTTERKIQLNNFSGKKDVKINVNKELLKGNEEGEHLDKPTFVLNIHISSSIVTGDLSIEIYDPKGIKKGKFSTSAETDKTETVRFREEVNGKINKKINFPMKGDWVVKVVAENTNGVVLISSGQSYTSYIAKER